MLTVKDRSKFFEDILDLSDKLEMPREMLIEEMKNFLNLLNDCKNLLYSKTS